MARLKELRSWKMKGKTFILLDFTAGKLADPANYPDGIIFRRGYKSNRTAERKMAQLRAAYQSDLIQQDSIYSRPDQYY